MVDDAKGVGKKLVVCFDNSVDICKYSLNLLEMLFLMCGDLFKCELGWVKSWDENKVHIVTGKQIGRAHV